MRLIKRKERDNDDIGERNTRTTKKNNKVDSGLINSTRRRTGRDFTMEIPGEFEKEIVDSKATDLAQ